jgi:hypothetical protein
MRTCSRPPRVWYQRRRRCRGLWLHHQPAHHENAGSCQRRPNSADVGAGVTAPPGQEPHAGPVTDWLRQLRDHGVDRLWLVIPEAKPVTGLGQPVGEHMLAGFANAGRWGVTATGGRQPEMWRASWATPTCCRPSIRVRPITWQPWQPKPGSSVAWVPGTAWASKTGPWRLSEKEVSRNLYAAVLLALLASVKDVLSWEWTLISGSLPRPEVLSRVAQNQDFGTYRQISIHIHSPTRTPS